MLDKIMKLTLRQYIYVLLLLNGIGIFLLIALGVQVNNYIAGGILSVLALAYLAIWYRALMRAKSANSYRFFAWSLAYWLLIGFLILLTPAIATRGGDGFSDLVSILPLLFLIIPLTGGFIGIMVLFQSYLAMIPVVIFGIGMTIWRWTQAVQEAKSGK